MMRKLWNKIRGIEKNTIIRNSFLLPILSVVVMSISHVISWYDLGNPISWAIYLSVAIEIFALASVSAASLKMKKGSIWFLFGLVTFIQIVGNVFFTYKEIDPTGEGFLSWVELIQPWFEDWSIVDHKRLLAYIQGGTLPFMSLIALHFYIKFNDNLKEDNSTEDYFEARNRKIEEMVAAKEDNEESVVLGDDDRDQINSMIEKELPKEEMIPDSVVKAELKEEQIEKEVKAEASNDIVTKVVQKPIDNKGHVYGHRKSNPGNNPQIMPGTN